MNRFICFILLAVTAGLLGGCTRTVIREEAAGINVSIEGERTGLLSRLPCFENKGDRMVMTKNGENCYSASIVSGNEYRDVFTGREPIAESSNMLVYKFRHEHPDFCDYAGYVYLMKLEGADDVRIRFDTDTAPNACGYGNDFTTCIHYYADKTETVPDTVFVMTGDDMKAPVK